MCVFSSIIWENLIEWMSMCVFSSIIWENLIEWMPMCVSGWLVEPNILLDILCILPPHIDQLG